VQYASLTFLRHNGRKLTAILYLQPASWSSGGALRLYPSSPAPPFDVPCAGGTAVIFWADMRHEVLPIDPGGGSRAALTIWLDGRLMPLHPSFLAGMADGQRAVAAPPPASGWWWRWRRVAAANKGRKNAAAAGG